MKKMSYTYVPAKTITKAYKATAFAGNTTVSIQMSSNDILDVQRKIEALARVTSLTEAWEIRIEEVV